MSFDVRKYLEDGATATPAAPIDVAAIMAKSGAKTEADNSAAVPDVIIEELKAEKSAEVKPEADAETATKPAEATAAADAPPPPNRTQEPALAPSLDWKQELKKADKAAILKELGYDDKMVGFFNKWSADGNITDYLKAVTVDYSKMTPEQLMRHQLQEDFPDWSPEDLNELYAAKVIERYKIDPEVNSETEIKRGRLELAADTKKIREGLIQKQQDYILNTKAPAPGPDEREVQAQQQEKEQREYMERYNTALTGHSLTKELMSSKKLVLGEGENAFNYEVADPQQLITILQNPQEYVKHVFQEDGSPTVDKQLLIAAMALDGPKVINELIKYGRSLGAKSAVEEIENAKKPEAKTTKPDAALTPAQALARNGIMTSND